MLVRVLLSVASKAMAERVEQLLDHALVYLTFAPPEDASSRLTSEAYDVAILDHVPPDGADVLDRARRLPDRPQLVLLAIDSRPEERAKWLAAGFSSVLDPRVDDALLGTTLRSFIERRRQERLDRLKLSRRQESLSAPFVSSGLASQALLRTVRQAALADSPVLLLGETGVGKERIATMLHTLGSRADGPFVAVNCAAIPTELFESELFGHHKGSFTGATRSRRGKFELAHRGTLFLDEVGEVPPHLQAKLLRVLTEGRIAPVGSDETVEVDLRIVAATNRDLRSAMEEGRFRQDLYYRLSVVELVVPPLRERPEEIPELADAYLQRFRAQLGREVHRLSDAVVAALTSYAWPGNVRELVNVIERAVLLARGESVELHDLPASVAHPQDERRPPSATPSLEPAPGGVVQLPDAWVDQQWKLVREALLEEGERAYLTRLLRETGGRVGLTAERAGMSPRAIFEKMRRHGLRKEDFRSTSN